MQRTTRTLGRIVITAVAVAGFASIAFAGKGTVQVPVRWCAVQGSPAVVNPACSCQTWSAWTVAARGLRASRAYANCNALFRPAGNQSLAQVFPSVQIIADPCDPNTNPACAGAQGDIEIDLSTNNLTEYFQAVQACRTAWNLPNTSAAGLIGVNIRRFVDPLGNPSNIAGLGGTPIFNNSMSQAAGGQFAVTDDDFTLDYSAFPQAGGNVLFDICTGGTPHPATPPCQPQWFTDSVDTLTSHEIGHALSLGHLSGTAMNATVPAPPTMTVGGFGQTANICPAQPFASNPTSQCGRIRLQSICHQNGTIVDPPPVVDEQPFTVGDAAPGYIDLDLAGVIDDGNTGSAGIFWRTAQPLPSNVAGVRFEFALDTDANPGTGGDPNLAGIPIPMTGAELTGSVTVDVTSGTVSGIGDLMRWDAGAFAFMPEPSLGALAEVQDTYVDEADPGTPTVLPGHTGVALDFDKNLLPGVGNAYVLQVRAHDPGSGGTDLPPSADVYLFEPNLPVCELQPDQAVPGQTVTVTASDLTPNLPAVVWFGKGGAPFEVGGGIIDPAGSISVDFTVPLDTPPGPHEVAVLIDGPDSFSSHCALEILPAVSDPGEASSAASQMVVTAFDKGTGEITISYGPSCEADEHAIYLGPLPDVNAYGYDDVVCGHDASGVASFAAGPGSRFWVIVGQNGATEGSYGKDGDGLERPEDDGGVASVCSLPQKLTATCP